MEQKDLQWLPEQDEEKLQLGFRIIQNAFKGKIGALESEIRALKEANEEKQNALNNLQKKNSTLEVEIIESHQRSQQMSEENKTLLTTVRSLRQQVEKLDRLKKAFTENLDGYNTGPIKASEGDASLYASEEYLRGAAPMTIAGGEMKQPPSYQSFSPAPNYSAPAASTTPAGDFNFSSSTPTPGSPQIDGKAFFRMARGKLSYENFNSFLANIKRLNNHQQTRDQTLEEARRLFGPAGNDLYIDFQALLNRHS